MKKESVEFFLLIDSLRVENHDNKENNNDDDYDDYSSETRDFYN